MFVTELVLAVLLAAVLLLAGALKVAGGAAIAAQAEHLGLPPRAYRLIGVVEAVGAAALLIGLAWSALGIAATAGVVLLMIGAVISHVRVGDPVAKWAPAAVLTAVAVAAFALRIATA